MKREVHLSSGFTRAMRRWLKKHPEMDPVLAALLEALTEDAFDASLGTHKLKGKWAEYYACSAGYDVRIVFEFFRHDGAEAIQLVTIGTHDDVYY